MESKEVIEFSLHEKQYDAFHSTKPYVAAIAGHRGGKTFVGALWAGKKIQDFPTGNGLIAAPTYPILRQATISTFFEVFPQYRKYYKEQKSVIELPTGGFIYIRSTDDPLGLEGMTLDWAWLDEAGMMKALVWNIIRARLSTRRGQLFISTTPYNLGWLYQEFYQPFLEGKDSDLAVYTWASVDNPSFPKDFAEKERNRLSPAEYSRRYLGQFTKMQGLVYDIQSDEIIDPDDTKIYMPEVTIGGIDWGFRNPTAMWIGRLKDGVWYTVDEWYETERTTAEIAEQALRLQRKWGVNRWYADYAEPDRIEELRRKDLYVLEGNKDLKGGISYVQQLIKDKRFFIFRSCRAFMDEINQYHYPEGKDGKPFNDEPEKFKDHLMDAMRYAVFTYQPQGGNDFKFRVRVQQNRQRDNSFS